MEPNMTLRIVAFVSIVISTSTSVVTLLLFLKGTVQLTSNLPWDDSPQNQSSNLGSHSLQFQPKNSQHLWLQSALKSSALVAVIALIQIVNSSILLASSISASASTSTSSRSGSLNFLGRPRNSESESSQPAPYQWPRAPLPITWLVITFTGVVVTLVHFLSPVFHPYAHDKVNDHEMVKGHHVPLPLDSHSHHHSIEVSVQEMSLELEVARENCLKYFVTSAIFLVVHALEIFIVVLISYSYPYGCRKRCCRNPYRHPHDGYRLFII